MQRRMIYNGVFLDDPKELLQWWIAQGFFMPKGAEVKCHHMTRAFKPKGEEQNLPYGDKTKVKVVGVAYTPQIGTVVVECSTPSRNRFKHITVWVDGIPPSKSNDLLEEGYQEVSGPTLSGRVGYFDGEVVRTD